MKRMILIMAKVQCSSGKPCNLLGSMWMLFDPWNPSRYCFRQCKPPRVRIIDVDVQHFEAKWTRSVLHHAHQAVSWAGLGVAPRIIVLEDQCGRCRGGFICKDALFKVVCVNWHSQEFRVPGNVALKGYDQCSSTASDAGWCVCTSVLTEP